MSLLSQRSSQVGDRSQAANRQVAAQCIAQPEHLQEIVAGLQSTNVALLGDCLEVLCKVAESQPHAVAPYAPALPPLLTHTTTRVRWETAHTLALLAPHVPETISSILPSLAHQLHSDSSTIVRDYSIDTLSAYATTGTSAAQAVVPLLETALRLWEGKHAGRALQLIKRASAFDHQPLEGVMPVTFALLCGSAFITRMVLAFLEQHGFCHDSTAAITLLIDEPRGFALAALVGRQAGHSVIHARRATRERSCSGDMSSSI